MVRGIALAGALALSALSAGVAQTARPPRGLRPYLVAISVPNIDASARWYQDVLGLRLADRKEYAAQGIKVAFLESDGFRLELVELKGSIDPGTCADVTNPAAVRGYGKLAFQVDDLNEVAARMQRRGTKIIFDSRASSEPGDKSVIVKDRDGNWLQFFERRR